ncbi:unnamed protein product [Camellia sinensis]|uniref:Uncharacterized protein n=1 Tax=Camellia sinensis TaxID=4442 RepID=A0A7J7H8E7_CAMSI|nr:hypothetical protein HYC85_013985 [Camellia sinensis]
MYLGSLITIASAKVFFEERYHGWQNTKFETTSCASTVLELPQDDNGSLQKTHAVGSCKERDMESHVSLSGEAAKLKETNQAPRSFSSTLLNASNPEVNDDEDKCIHSGCKVVEFVLAL